MTAQLFDFPNVAPSMVDPPKKKKPTKKTISYTEEFETKVWGPYPRKLNCSKLMAFQAWDRLPDECQAQAIAAIPIFARLCVGKDEAYIPHCATWLNQRRFETIQAPIHVAPQQTINTDWASVMKLYRITSNWRQEYGPSPGSRGCRVPPEYLDEM